MSGANFTPPPYRPHVAHIIKQNTESKTGTPAPVADDAELFAVLRPDTIYNVRIMLAFSVVSTGLIWRPACTSSVALAAIVYHRGVQTNAGDLWSTGSAGDHVAHLMDTTLFNSGTSSFYAAQAGSREALGVIKTGSGGGTFSIKWGGANLSPTLKAGSFMLLTESVAY